MDREIRLLLAEDVETDAELVVRELKRAGFRCNWHRVETEEDFRRELGAFAPDVILSDFTMPLFDGMTALEVARELAPDVPFIFVSGTLGEDYAIRALKNGATDYVLKNNLMRLPPAIERALKEAEDRRARHKLEAELEETRSRLQSIISSLHEIVWSLTPPPVRVLYVNPAVERVYRRPMQAFIDNPGLWFEMVHPDDKDRVAADSMRSVRGESVSHEFRVVLPDGRVRWIASETQPAKDAAGRVVRIDGISRDITQQKKHERRISRLTRIYAVLSGINALIVRAQTRDELFSEACRIAVQAGSFRFAWLGVVDREAMRIVPTASNGLDQGFLDLIRPRLSLEDDASEGTGPAALAVRGGETVIVNDMESDARIRYKEVRRSHGLRSEGFFPIVVSGQAIAILALYADETDFFDEEELRLLHELAGDIGFAVDHIAKQERLDYLAYYDALTGLANRALFRDRLSQQIREAKRGGHKVAVYHADLERFRAINDSFGRQAGDQLLRQVAERLTTCIGNANELARIGADHFAVMAREIDAPELAARLAEDRLQRCFAKPIESDGRQLHIGVRVGIALYPDDGADAETLMHNAEAASRRAKLAGEPYLFYTQQMTARIAEKFSLESSLRGALERSELVLHYQPKVETASGEITGAEALMRWQSPERGLVPPVEFIPLMEETGMIVEAGRWALEQAARDQRRLAGRGRPDLRIAVNVSAIQLRRNDFVAQVEGVLRRETGPCGIDLEITESLIMQDVEGNIAKLGAARELGARVAIDDFGTGYSSLAYLAKLPVDSLKIDRSFIVRMLDDPDTMTLVQTVISLAHSLRLEVVAEGVDSEEQAKMLRLLRCNAMQGFLVSRPLAFDDLTALIEGKEPGRAVRNG